MSLKLSIFNPVRPAKILGGNATRSLLFSSRVSKLVRSAKMFAGNVTRSLLFSQQGLQIGKVGKDAGNVTRSLLFSQDQITGKDVCRQLQ